MIINNIKLKNFGCISRFERSFGKGLFILSGENGNGKSTVFKAIVLALFDSYEGSLGDYVNWNADEFGIDIDFEHLGKSYNVSVKYNKKTTERQVTDKATGDVYTGQEAKDFLKKVFDQELIKAAMLSLEQQIDVVTVKPADRREYLKRIYDLEFKNQQLVLADGLSNLEKEITALNTQLGILRGKDYEIIEVSELPMTEAEYDALQTVYSENMEKIGKLKAEKERYETVIKTINDLTAEVKQCGIDIANYEKQIEEKKKALEALPVESKKRTVLLEAEINLGELELKMIGTHKKNELEQKDRLIAGIQIVRVPVFDQEAYTKVRADLATAKSKVEELGNSIIENICPTCGQKLSQDETALEKRKADLAAYQKQVDELTDRSVELEKDFQRIDQLNKVNQESKDKKAKLAHERELAAQRHDAHFRETQLSVDSKKTAVANEADNLKRLEEAGKSELAALSELLGKTSSKKAGAEKNLIDAEAATVSNPADELDKVQVLTKDVKAKIDNYQNARTERETAIKQNEAVLKQKELDAAEIKRLDDELQEKSRDVTELESCAKILKNEFPVFVISKIVKDLEKAMNDFLRKTYAGRYTVKLEDKKNALRMVYGPKGMDAGMASGYEKSIFSLAWKWALSYVQKNKTLMLDEVDSAASQKNSMLFYQTVGDSLKLFDQILIVSHKEQTRELLENEYGAQVLTFVNGAAA